MSGRLVILPHKQWHVWNKDNRERVKRDERLNKEQQERDRLRDSSLQQEFNLAQLKASSRDVERGDSAQVEGGAGSQTAAVSFSLFPNIDEELRQKEARDERARAQKQKDLLLKRREGVAEWGLGEGSSEQTKITPWYLQTNKSNSSDTNGIIAPAAARHSPSIGLGLAVEVESAAKRRDRLRQEQDDPILKFMKLKPQSTSGPGYISTEERVRVALELSRKRDRLEDSDSHGSSDSDQRRKEKKHNKKDKKHNKKDKKHTKTQKR